MAIDFIQIVYHKEQVERCYPFAKIYHSCGLTRYFENAIIAGLVPLLEKDYISVCSWRLKQKRGDSQIGLGNNLDLSVEKILAADSDVCILTPRSPIHKTLQAAESWHGEAWAKAFPVFKGFLHSINITVNSELKYSIYENHFVARKDIYHAYVREALIPAMEFMDGEDVFMSPSNYARLKHKAPDSGRVFKMLGMNDWPIAPFILERLFSIWIHDKGLKVSNV